MKADIPSLLREEMIALEPELVLPPVPEPPAPMEHYPWQCKEAALRVLVDIMCRSDEVRNPTKLLKDLVFREKCTSTGIGEGIAIPHVRTMQPRGLVMGFVRFSQGIEFCSVDDAPVFFMFGIVTPPYEDRLYFEVLKWVGRMFGECTWLRDALMAAETPAEVRGIFLGLARGNM